MTLEKKNIATCIILTFVTCGFYGIYWFYCMISDINTISEDPDSMSPIIVILLSIITCGIYSVYWFYKAGALLDQKAIESFQFVFDTYYTGIFYTYFDYGCICTITKQYQCYCR